MYVCLNSQKEMVFLLLLFKPGRIIESIFLAPLIDREGLQCLPSFVISLVTVKAFLFLKILYVRYGM